MNNAAPDTENITDADISAVLNQVQEYALVVLDKNGNIVKWNARASILFHKNEATVINKPFSHLFSKFEPVNLAPADILQNAAFIKFKVFNAVHIGAKNAEVFVHTVVNAMFNAENELKGFLMICRDVTYEKNLETEYRQLNEQLEEKVNQRTQQLTVVNSELEAFSYSVSHDLRTPLRAISGFAEILLEDYAERLDDEGKRVIGVIVSNSKMMGRLIDDLLTFSKLSRLKAEREEVDMNRLIGKCLEVLFLLYEKSRYEIIIRPLHNCSGDANMMLQAWSNLLGNALKYSSKTPNPIIEVGSSLTADKVTYYVKDNGVGFDMQYAHKLFGVFQRLHRPEEFEGTGLGLALVKRIISKHGGDIWATSEVNAGATFFFSLPLINSDTHSKKNKNEQPL